MQRAQTLIDKAAKMCGSFYALSKVTGIPQSNMTNVMHGKRKMPMEWVPLMADIAGADVQTELALILAEQLPPESKARRVLEKVQATGAAAMLLLCITVAGSVTPGDAKARAGRAYQFDNVYIVEYLRAIISRLWFGLRHMAQAPSGAGFARIGPAYQ